MTSPQPPVKPSGSFLAGKWGPLPVWAWLLIGLGGALAYSVWQKNKSTASDSTAPTDGSVPNQTPPQVFQDYVTVNVPPDAGRTSPPTGGANPPPPGGTTTPPPGGGTHVPPPGGSGSTTPPTPGPSPTPPGGQWVTVSKYTSSNPPWNSTLWGIAQHLLGNGSKWTGIWNNAQNAALKARRKDPKLIQPGDKIWVPQ